MTAFVTRYHDERIIDYIESELKEDVLAAYPEIKAGESADLMDLLLQINKTTGERFVFIIDEWDAICREFKPGTPAMDRYVSWLRRMFKDVTGKYVFAFVYMTGILPIKKYKYPVV